MKDYRLLTDKYFLRSKKILKSQDINPTVRYQVFVRKDIEKLQGINEAVEWIKSKVTESKVFALEDGDSCVSGEPLIKLEGPIQELVDLETVYLGIISGRLTDYPDFYKMRVNAEKIIEVAENKPVYYFGARHYHWKLDKEISRTCKQAGFAGCSTDAGGWNWGAKGIGTIPHSLILAYAIELDKQGIDVYDKTVGKSNATVLSALAFDEVIQKNIPRVQLIDTFNREVWDSIETATALQNLDAVRIDTCRSNLAQGTQELELPYIYNHVNGNGVSISAVWNLRTRLDETGFNKIKIIVSSGFNAEKIQAFVDANRLYQQEYGNDLFNSIGTGSIYDKAIYATSDIVAYKTEGILSRWKQLSKVGREEVPTDRLIER